jgi:hypothetical protein
MMFRRWQLTLNNRLVAWAGIIGIGLMPCPDCGLPLAIKVWPVAGLVWLFRRLRQRSQDQLDLLLTDDLAARADLTPQPALRTVERGRESATQVPSPSHGEGI